MSPSNIVSCLSSVLLSPKVRFLYSLSCTAQRSTAPHHPAVHSGFLLRWGVPSCCARLFLIPGVASAGAGAGAFDVTMLLRRCRWMSRLMPQALPMSRVSLCWSGTVMAMAFSSRRPSGPTLPTSATCAPTLRMAPTNSLSALRIHWCVLSYDAW